MEEKINLNQLGDEQPDPSLADLEMEVRLLEWTISKKMKVAKLLQNLSYDNATRKLSIVYGNDVTLPDFSIPKGYINGFEFLSSINVNYITINEGVCIDSTGTFTIELTNALKKYYSLDWSIGDNGNSNDGSTYVASGNNFSFIFAIKNTASGAVDILTSKNSTPTLPTGYDIYRLIGSFLWTSNNLINKLVGNRELYTNYEHSNNYSIAMRGFDLPKDYYNDYLFVHDTGTIFCENLIVRDVDNKVNIIIDNIGKYTSVFSEGEFGGAFESAMTVSTDYYIFAVGGVGKSEDLFVSTSESPSLPTGFTWKAIIGYGNCDNLGIFRAWKKGEGWLDENFDIANLAKPANTEADAPTYEDLFGNGIKVACFSNVTSQFVSSGKEYSHSGKDGFGMQWHFHYYPATSAAGNVLMFLDYYIGSEDEVITNLTFTRITKLFAVNGVAGKQTSIGFDFVNDATLKEGTQIWFRFGRLNAGVISNYAAKIAVRTFGFHYLEENGGSNFITHN